MALIACSAGLVCIGALVLGQAILKLCGARAWNWLAAPVGFASAMLVATVAIHVPGRAVTTAVALALLVVGCGGWIALDRRMRPPLADVVATLPTAALTMVPFLAAGRPGTLGVSFNNDMAAHLLLAEAYRSETVERIATLAPLDYPLGPHALAAVLAEGLGTGVDTAFAGVTVAAPVLLAMTALGLLGDAPRWTRILGATVASMPFLVAGYYAQGSFKEIHQAVFVLAAVVAIAHFGALPTRTRFVPLALVCAGSVSVYSLLGLPWPVGIGGAALLVAATVRLRAAGPAGLLADARAHGAAFVGAVALGAVVLAPQAPRILHFLARAGEANRTGISDTDLGNLIAPLPLWEAFGIWHSADYRLPAPAGFAADAWTAVVVVFVGIGVAWALARRRWLPPLGIAVGLLIWSVSDRTQSPYVAAKALVILSPLLLLVAVHPLLATAARTSKGRLRVLAYGGPLVALVLAGEVAASSWNALRSGLVGPRDHSSELHALRPYIDGRSTLFLGNSDFTLWELAGTRVDAPVAGFQRLPFAEDKPWSYGQALDFDSVSADTLNRFDFAITTRDAAASEPPPQMHAVRRTVSFVLWRRTGAVTPRRTLLEGDGPGARLDCRSAAGRRIARGGGVAAIRPEPVVVAAPAIAPGTRVRVELPLARGVYDLSTPYTAAQPLLVEVPHALATRLPANLDRPGPRYHIGRLRVRGDAPTVVSFYATKTRLTPPTAASSLTAVVAQRAGGRRVLPIRQACGRYVDWFRPRVP